MRMLPSLASLALLATVVTSQQVNDTLPLQDAVDHSMTTAASTPFHHGRYNDYDYDRHGRLYQACARRSDTWCGRGLACAYPPDAPQGTDPICLPVRHRPGDTCTIPSFLSRDRSRRWRRRRRRDDDDPPVVCGRGMECYQGECIRVNAFGVFCSLPGQTTNFCGRGVCQESLIDFGGEICQARARVGEKCSYLIACVDGSVCVEDEQDPIGYGICR